MFLTNPQIVRDYQILLAHVSLYEFGGDPTDTRIFLTVCVCVCVCFLCQLISGKSLTIFPAKFFFAKV